ncbi:SAM hydrolase/SAM-dependent halogenase family protein [Desulforhabdus amnigena]|jgi:S-adenosylmethionine hydrolase|uniref:SAM-dependent chlorinase/fluorinase n=1 Tax=Desulforhabdus amnigena TaxID=40218 RepID=A0A9W6D2P0_9BACT|nr:SAM-dependent chlorinase/fluorinase [Desulforhabdus amnigena]NLJ28865.1 SAM-dependent chlorinase/fluorinase [Deltaproteobacteria bacterium]GLI33117.1 hypothetical protein DAMNIGENAA_05500 [Desulforhabdus amnigena]
MSQKIVITLLTDFGIEDGYVASLKGVILGLCPEAALVDISHSVPPQDVRAGAFLLSTVYRDFPKGTIHLAVVDPGVGTERRGLALQTGSYQFVGPDNGLFSLVIEGKQDLQAYSLENPVYWRPEVSNTFHGRDIFAPVAAHLACGVPIDLLGPSCTPIVADWVSPSKNETGLRGEVIYIDHFGNCITNVTAEHIEGFIDRKQCIVRVAQRMIPGISKTYAEAAEGEAGEVLALVGSSGHLEIAVNRGSAAKNLKIPVGEPIIIYKQQL